MAKTAEAKTKATDASVADFLNNIADEQQRKDSFEILEMMGQATQEEPKMWGASIVGFGSYHYKYESGREGDSLLVGFSPRKQNITLYLMSDFEQNQRLLKKLGKHSIGKACLYIKRLSDVDVEVLKELITESVKTAKQIQSS